MIEYYIYHIPVYVVNDTPTSVSIPQFCEDVEEILPRAMLGNVEVVYVGKFDELKGKNAAFSHGAIYITSAEPTNFDMLENFIHETAHALEETYGWEIYTDDLVDEFKGKRRRLYHLLTAAGFHINPSLYDFTEYNRKFDEFLAYEVGYPTLTSLTMGLFSSPYGATSIQEYFANGFEKYILGDAKTVRKLSPVLYQKIKLIESTINDIA
jgi:hypothetical protein